MRDRIRLPVLLAAFLATALLAAGCASGDDSDAPARSMQASMQEMAYSTTALTASRGEHIRIELENRGQLTHDFTIDRMPVQGLHTIGGASAEEHQHKKTTHAVHLALDQGASGWLEFSPTTAGMYEFYCAVPGHRDAGMRGTLTVE